MSPITSKCKPTRSAQFLFKESRTSGVLINLDKYSYFVMNPTAQTVWKQINGKNTLHDIAKKFAGKYGLTVNKAARDIRNCIVILNKNGFIKFQ